MLNVFSDSMKMSEQIKTLQKEAGSKFERLLFAGPEGEPLYMLKPKAVNLLNWVNEKILFELPRAKMLGNVQWIGVRIRIATNMLNKLEAEGVLAKEVCIEYHKRLVSNVRQILENIYTEDLPF